MTAPNKSLRCDAGAVEPRLTDFDEADALLLAPDDDDTPSAG
jgi:hypothetical protein